MRNLLEAVREATEEQDKKFRAEAISFYNKLKNYDWKNNAELTPRTDKFFKNKPLVQAGKIDPRYKDLRIILTDPGKEVKGMQALFDASKAPKIVDIIFDPEGLENPDLRKYFVHEFVHYLDYSRTKNKEVWSRGSSIASNAEEAYYNNPVEFNSYYQQGVSNYMESLSNILRRGDKRDILTFVPVTFDKFFKVMTIHFLNRNFVKNLNERNLRKLKKRLFNLYQRAKKSSAKIK